MSIELLKHITETEVKAAEIQKKSQEEGNRILAAAKAEGLRLIRQSIEEAEKQSEIIVKQAEAAVNLQMERKKEQVSQENIIIRKNAAEILDEAAKAIMERIVNTYVRR